MPQNRFLGVKGGKIRVKSFLTVLRGLKVLLLKKTSSVVFFFIVRNFLSSESPFEGVGVGILFLLASR